jgi:hypothetical protein
VTTTVEGAPPIGTSTGPDLPTTDPDDVPGRLDVREHEVTVADDAATAAAITAGIAEVCDQGPPGAAHRVVHIVEDEVG